MLATGLHSRSEHCVDAGESARSLMCQIELLHYMSFVLGEGFTKDYPWFHVWPRQNFSVTLPLPLPHSNRVWGPVACD